MLIAEVFLRSIGTHPPNRTVRGVPAKEIGTIMLWSTLPDGLDTAYSGRCN
jgi:hypothetical protein